MSRTSPPIPFVQRHMRGKHKLRKGRGFSLGELKQAGLQEFRARSMKIRIDERRSTIHARNVTSLTDFLASPTQKPAAPEPTLEVPAVASRPKKAPERRGRKAKKAAAKRSSKRKR